MSKFPDPTKDYAGKPVGGTIDTAQPPAPGVIQNDSAPVEGSAPSPAPPIYTAPLPTAPPPPAAPPPPPAGGPPPEPLPVSPSPFRNLIPIVIGIVVVILFATLGLTFIPKLFKSSGPVTLTYWGLWEPSSVMQPVISAYESTHPNVKIEYTMQSPQNYRSRLQTAISTGSAPDIARLHNTWLPEIGKSLSPAPDTVAKGIDLNSYYPVVKKDAVSGGKLYALPLEVDGLALFYNTDMLAAENATPPSDWNTLRKLAFDLTKKNPDTGLITQAGAALGTTGNVEHWSDILGLLILQNSGSPGHPSATAVQDAITFYTIFSTTDKSWDASQPNSIYAFATGTVAMILAPSWEVAQIKAINPDLKFSVAPAPTLPSTNVAWASYWLEAVPSSSKHPTEAWEFIQYLSSQDTLQKLYAAESQVHTIGEPYPLTAMASTLANDPLAGAFVTQGPAYTSWPLASRTYDDGLNDGLIKYYEDAINAVNDGSTVASVINTLDSGVQQVLAKYPGVQ